MSSISRLQNLALGGAVVSLLAIALAYGATLLSAAAPAWGAWCLAIGTAGLFASLTILGAVRADRPRKTILLAVLFIFVIIAGPFAAALLLAPENAQSALILGLPVRAAIVIYAIGVFPALVLPFVYARTFESLTLSPDDLARVRALAQRARETSSS